jgi:outer membrane receptor protein involved in Fe transport
MTSNSSLTIWRNAILASAALLVVAPLGAIADEAPEVVVVTGTRIPRPEFDLPNPVTTLDATDISHSGATNLTDYLKRIPALVSSLGDVETSGLNTTVTDAGSSLRVSTFSICAISALIGR